VDAAVSAEIFLSAMMIPYQLYRISIKEVVGGA